MYGLLAANTGARGTSSTRQTPPFHVLAYIDDLYGDFDIFIFWGVFLGNVPRAFRRFASPNTSHVNVESST